MANAGSLKQLEVALKELEKKDVRRIVLCGEPGVGKTWMARKLSDHAIKEQLFDVTLWLSLHKKYNFDSLKDIARQMSLLPVSDEWEFENAADDEDFEVKKEELRTKTLEALESKKVLLILDGEGSQITEQEILQELKGLLPQDAEASHKFIITSTRDVPYSEGLTTVINVQCLSKDESICLLQTIVAKRISETPRIRDLANYFLDKSKRWPYEVIVIGKALSYFGRDESGLRMLEKVKEENVEQYNILQLLSYGYEPLPRNILIDCCCIDNQFLRKRGSVYFNELINHWILEGYLGKFDSIGDAYNVGHSVLMELMDCGLLKTVGAWPCKHEGGKISSE